MLPFFWLTIQRLAKGEVHYMKRIGDGWDSLRRLMLWLTIATLLLSVPHSGLAQDHYSFGDIRFFHVTIEDGLSQSTVRAVYQDSDGFMWFGTQGGLDRYDGKNFVKPSLS